jgi:single-strand DNA-binding protein
MTQVTIIGNLTDAPELRFVPSGKGVANFTVAESQRVKENGEWKDGPTTFWRCRLWDTQAENMTESLTRGQRVIVVGEAKERSFETKAGEKRSVVEVTVSEVGPSLRWATAKVEKAGKSPAPKRVEDDPWSAAPAVGDESEAPF